MSLRDASRADWKAFDNQQLGEPDADFYATRCEGCDGPLDVYGYCSRCEETDPDFAKTKRDAGQKPPANHDGMTQALVRGGR